MKSRKVQDVYIHAKISIVLRLKLSYVKDVQKIWLLASFNQKDAIYFTSYCPNISHVMRSFLMTEFDGKTVANISHNLAK